MIEVNRKLYMDESGFKNEGYETLKEELSELLGLIENTWVAMKEPV
jgi:hypothetical protein